MVARLQTHRSFHNHLAPTSHTHPDVDDLHAAPPQHDAWDRKDLR